MRGNGLSAESYQEIAEVEPARLDALLGLLGEHEIAAYATALDDPAEESRMRLYVDAARTEAAIELLDREPDEGQPEGQRSLSHPKEEPDTAEGTAELDEDAVWSQIIAAYGEEPNDPVPRWPVSEDTDSSDGEGEAAPVASARSYGDHGEELPPLRTTDETERFVPPTPPPLPRLDPVTKAAWLAVLGAPALFILAIALQLTLPNWLTGVVAAAFIGGMIALFMRLKSGPPDDTDDGAVV